MLCFHYMFPNKWVLVAFLLYTFFSVFCIYSAVTSYSLYDAPRLFIQDPNAPGRITAAIASDHNMAFIARLFHNKVLVSWQVFCDSLYRSVDLPFLFSLTERAALYDNPGKMQMLPAFELPFFFIALIAFVRYWKRLKRYGMLLLVLLGFSLLCSGLFWPFIFPLKLIPLMITIQLFIFFGCVGLLQEGIWSKR